MATSVAHGMIGIAFYCTARSLSGGDKELPLSFGMLLLVALVANIPDMDMIISLLLYGDHRVLHGGVTHTLFFSGAGGFMVWMFAKSSFLRMELSFAAALVLFSHVLVDFFTGPSIGFNPSHGVTPFLPVVESRIISPVTIFKGVEHSNILPGALLTALWEFVLLLPVTAMIIYRSGSGKNNFKSRIN